MIKVQRENFDVGAEINQLLTGQHRIGGVCNFIGFVRDQNDRSPLTAMTLEHYPGMTEKQLEKIEEQACLKWALEGSLIIHRFGRLMPGEQIVLVVTASKHRQAAFESCQFLVDFLKTQAPFWKKEDYGSDAKWVEARVSDQDAIKKWN